VDSAISDTVPQRCHVLRRGVSNRGTSSAGAFLGQLDPTIRSPNP
jgi:hypothetical protein